MDRVERHQNQDKELKNLCHLSKNLYNYANYCLRQSFIKTGKLPREFDLTTKLARRNQVDYRALPAQTSQQIIKLLYKNWKSFFKANREYKKKPEKFLGRPKLPKYKKKDGLNIVVFTGQQCKLRDNYVYFPNKIYNRIKTKVTNIRQVRIIPQATCFVIEIVYRKEISSNENLNKEKFLSIDLGVNNLATCFNNVDLRSFIINGRLLKSINQYSNKLKSKYMSYVGSRGTSNRINRLMLKRENLIRNYLHHSSRYIVNYCLNNDIGTIIIGLNSDWKQETKMGKRRNQNFVCIPFKTLLNQIQYKAEEVGITVILTEESYTSKIDHLALETLCHHEKYLGRRVSRGLFKSSTGVMLNADVNGAIGIARKAIGNGFLAKLNRGYANYPVRVNPLTKVTCMSRD